MTADADVTSVNRAKTRLSQSKPILETSDLNVIGRMTPPTAAPLAPIPRAIGRRFVNALATAATAGTYVKPCPAPQDRGIAMAKAECQMSENDEKASKAEYTATIATVEEWTGYDAS
ncbi:hypothetical protein LTR64_002147 [Lithohypha guttulata]|uniref:uncharacterized protein n=1 Tax=Lithohypha guttulata TaxID=1690604 RepID=UPI00315CCAF5